MKKTILKTFTHLIAGALALCLAACGNDAPEGNAKRVRIGVVGEANEMWKPVIEAAAQEGIEIRLVSFSDYSTPNRALNDGEVELNAFQHHAFFNADCKSRGFALSAIGDTFISAMNIYSKNIKSIDELKNGDKIAIPNDPTNGGRALKVLQAAGVIDLRAKAGDSPELSDVVANPKNIKFVEVDAANIYGLLPDVAAGVINCNFALDFGLVPARDAIFRDSANTYAGKAFVNLIAARTAEKDNPVFRRIVEIYQTHDGVKQSYLTDFKGAYIPGWKE